MSGNTNLQEVLNSLQVSCDEVEYGFATATDDTTISSKEVLCIFHEAEGLTIVASKDYLSAKDFTFEGTYAKLTIEVHTSLELVGLTAVLAKALADNGISANVIAAYYHDHVFVQYDVRQKATDILLGLKQ